MLISFPNLQAFFNYREFCPLCYKRLTPSILYPFPFQDVSDCELYQNELIVRGIDNLMTCSIDIKTNQMTKMVRSLEDSLQSILSQFTGTHLMSLAMECKRYHFFVSANVSIDHQFMLSTITLDKLHFIEQNNNKHYNINIHYPTNETSIRITRAQASQEIITKLIDFDFANYKRIINKLNHIELLA